MKPYHSADKHHPHTHGMTKKAHHKDHSTGMHLKKAMGHLMNTGGHTASYEGEGPGMIR